MDYELKRQQEMGWILVVALFCCIVIAAFIVSMTKDSTEVILMDEASTATSPNR